MPELRIDPLSGQRTIVAGERSRRPGGEPTCEPPAPIDPESDPFAEGHEDRTPPELYALRPAGGPADSPGLDGAGRAEPLPGPRRPPDGRRRGEIRSTPGAANPSCCSSFPATGSHEVIINGPQPVLSLAELPLEQVQRRGRGMARADAGARRTARTCS